MISSRPALDHHPAEISFAIRWVCHFLSATILVPILSAVSLAEPATGPSFWIRVNQVGYLPGDPKIALLSSAAPLTGNFSVGEMTVPIGADCGAWGPFAHNYRLDFSELKTSGRYQIQFQDIRSAEFSIGGDAYRNVPDQLLSFMQLQRCGKNPVTGKLCHQQDGIDTETGKQVNLVGGWHDAADRLKHMITTSYCVAALKLAGASEESAHGAELLRKLHPDAETLYVQIGDDRDHASPNSLWHGDQTDYGWGPGGARSAWQATGQPEGPKHKNKSSGLASLAGRCAAALALEGDLQQAESLYRLAQAHPGCAMSVPVRAPYYYGESTYFDDLQWAAIELNLATGQEKYLQEAVEYARQAGPSQWMGRAEHGHYEFFPYVNLAHWRLYPKADRATQQQLAGYYRQGLERVEARARKNPYRHGTPLVWCSTNDVIAVATQAVLYESMTGDTQFRSLAAEARDWVFGRNPWGVSFVIGVPVGGEFAKDPHHPFSKVGGILPVGGLVDGPVTKQINDSLKYSAFGEDRYARFQSDVAVYHGVYEDFSTNEPIIDGTVSLLLLLSLWK